MSMTEERREVTHANGVPPPDLDLPVRDYTDYARVIDYMTTSFYHVVPREPR